jgi:hypothetical protein
VRHDLMARFGNGPHLIGSALRENSADHDASLHPVSVECPQEPLNAGAAA